MSMVPSPRPPAIRYRSLDHWRGLACLLVVIYHSTIMYGALGSQPDVANQFRSVAGRLLALTHQFNVGVALFFVISGYCISAAADNARRRGHSVRWYFVRRFRRIYPPFWIVVLCSALFIVLVDVVIAPGLLSREPWPQLRPWWYSPAQLIGNITLTETWRHHLIGPGRAHFPGQAWTLCYEEQFYAITGLLLIVCPRRFFTGAAVVSGVTLFAVAVSALFAIDMDGFFFDGSWLLFAAGIIVYQRINYASGLQARVLEAALILAVPLSWFLRLPEYGATFGFGFAAMLPFLHSFDDRAMSARVLRPLAVCGQMCYSLYLVHQLPVKAISAWLYSLGLAGEWSTLLVTVPASLGVAGLFGWAFYMGVERRFLNPVSVGANDAVDWKLLDRADTPVSVAAVAVDAAALT